MSDLPEDPEERARRAYSEAVRTGASAAGNPYGPDSPDGVKWMRVWDFLCNTSVGAAETIFVPATDRTAGNAPRRGLDTWWTLAPPKEKACS